MASSTTAIEILVREYLLFRGFTGTVKSFDADIKADKSKGFRVESIVDQFKQLIYSFDILSLRKYWKYFDISFFSQLGSDSYKIIQKLETDILKLYIVNATQSSRTDKVNEFFEKYVIELQQEDSWRYWFALPFTRLPEQSKVFEMYFTKTWQESVILSLANCLNTVFSNISLPSLLNFEKEKRKVDKLEEENQRLREQISVHLKEMTHLRNELKGSKISVETQTANDLTDGDLLARGKRKSPTSKPKFGPWKLFKDKDRQNVPPKVTVKDIVEDKNQLRTSLDETGLRKLHLSSKQPSINGNSDLEDKRNSVDNISSSSSLDIDEGGPSQMDGVPQMSQFYLSLENDKEKNTDASTIPPVLHPAASNGTASKSSIQTKKVLSSPADDVPDKPFIVLSQDEFKEHTSSIISCKFSDNNNFVASLDIGGIVKIWQCYPTISSTAAINLKNDYISLDWVPKLDGKLLLGRSNGNISLLDVNSPKKNLWEQVAHHKFKRVNSITCSPVSHTAVCSIVATSNDQKKISSTQQKLIKMKQYSSHNIPTNAKEGSLSLWDLNVGQKMNDLSLDPFPVCIHALSYNHNGTLVVSGGADGMIRLFDIRSSDCLIGWHAHSSNVLDVKFNSAETCIYSMGADGKLCVWDINKVSSKIAEFPLHSGSTGSYHYIKNDEEIPTSNLIACDSDGNHMMTCAPSGQMIYQINPNTNMDEKMHIICRCSEVLTLDWTSSPNCSMAMCGTRKGTVQISTLLKK